MGVRTYRSSTGIATLVICSAVSVFLLVDAVNRGSFGLMLLYAPWILLVLWLIYEISVASMVRVDDDGVVVQNLLRRTTFGWRRVADMDLRWQLDFQLDDGRKLSCWGGPGRAQSPRPGRKGEDPKVPQSLRALTEISDRRDLAAAREEFAPGEGVDAPIRRTWDWRAAFAIVVIVVWAGIAIAVTR
ncbi:PH domain-containing protein [Microbacterium sp. ASV81]|uniref:PH domain-containing protein n=1 Tax=Microbacterium capsulatum TaxID=3041921 RepID=A0ABU0XFT9_9MICO|nr:PH domain-containing protein [Microbacterium sp. ASV81]MDQ4213991.1 PH domain-containing protein [Microbacterium sp. ASV81]